MLLISTTKYIKNQKNKFRQGNIKLDRAFWETLSLQLPEVVSSGSLGLVGGSPYLILWKKVKNQRLTQERIWSNLLVIVGFCIPPCTNYGTLTKSSRENNWPMYTDFFFLQKTIMCAFGMFSLNAVNNSNVLVAESICRSLVGNLVLQVVFHVPFVQYW